MSYSIVKIINKFDPITYNICMDEIEIIQTHDSYMKAIKHFDEVIKKNVAIMRSNGFDVHPEPYKMGNDIMVQIVYKYGTVELIFTNNYMKYV